MADNLAAVMGSLEGYVFDNLAWGGQWDAYRRDVKVPSIVFDSDQPDVHGSWYAQVSSWAPRRGGCLALQPERPQRRQQLDRVGGRTQGDKHVSLLAGPG